MNGIEVKLLITDFDGTLVDTFQANFMAYQKAFREVGLILSEKDYRRCFGLRFDKFMEAMGIYDAAMAQNVKEMKSFYYPEFFSCLKVNEPLFQLFKSFKLGGGKTAIASTARRENLTNVLIYIGAIDVFDYILAGEDVKEGKPSPEIYNSVLRTFDIQASEALVFEDSKVGIQSAQAAGVNYIVINSSYYGN